MSTSNPIKLKATDVDEKLDFVISKELIHILLIIVKNNTRRKIMKEKCELVLHIYQDAEMASYTLTKLLRDLKDRDNKIKKTLEDILKEYEEWKSKSKAFLKENNAEIDETSMFEKMMAKMGIDKEVKKDNSDASLADLLIKGVSMGSIDMEKKINEYKDDVDEKELSLAKKFLKFQEKTIDLLKEYL